MLQNIFLTYANRSLEEDPESLHKIFQEIYPFVYPDSGPEYKTDLRRTMDGIITSVVELSKYKRPPKDETELYCEAAKFDSDKANRFDLFKYRLAYEAIFGYRNGYCKEECEKRSSRVILGKEKFSGSKRLNCYECGRLYFVNILSGLAKGLEYSKIKGFESLLWDSYYEIRRSVRITDASIKTPFREELREGLQFNLGTFVFEDIDRLRGIFLSCLEPVIGFSLAQFLLNNDRRKLKICSSCRKFYFAKTINTRQRYCSEKCRRMRKWSAPRWAEYMRKYRERKKQEANQIKKEEREKEIQKMMEILDISRDEAEDAIQEDEKM